MAADVNSEPSFACSACGASQTLFKRYTLCIGYGNANGTETVLLGLKQRGFGRGKWNGFGGKVEAGENVCQAALRELYEEAGVHIVADGHPSSARCTTHRHDIRRFRWAGCLCFTFEAKSMPRMHVDVFSGSICACREPRASDEMIPQWYAYSQIPYESMWPDDAIWLPLLLQQDQELHPRILIAEFIYNDDADNILKSNVRLLPREQAGIF
jgi:8-oxo-dGTP pyrophosphatase MutT (NUDIX family)